MAIPRKTMRDIHTLSGRVDRIANPHMAYMQITCLEMEKARKGRERASALQRVEIINARLRDIEAEKATLLRALTERGAALATAQPSPGSWPVPSRRTGGLKLRY
jgi:hypothetical protein